MLATLRNSYKQRRAAKIFDRVAKIHPLRYLFMELTRKCNLACAYCGSDCSPSNNQNEMDSGEWIEILHQIAEDFNAGDVMLAFTGGEPLLKPGFFNIIDEAGSLGFNYGMVSNGLLLNSDTAKQLASCGIGSISLSLDAPPEINDIYRGNGAADKVKQAVSNLRTAGYKGRLEIISTIVKPVIPHLARLRKLIAEMHIAEWRLAPVIPIGRASSAPELVPDDNDIREILEFIRAGRSDGYLPRPEFGEECYLGESYEEVVRPFRFQCRAGLTIGGILSDGKIGACPELASCFLQGDIRTDRFADIWERRYGIFRDRSWSKRGFCAECDSFTGCMGGSLHLYPDTESEPLRCFYKMLSVDKLQHKNR